MTGQPVNRVRHVVVAHIPGLPVGAHHAAVVVLGVRRHLGVLDCPGRAAAKTSQPPSCLPLEAPSTPRHCRSLHGGHLAAYKVPRRVVVLEVLSRSLIGKVLRREIQDTLRAG